MKKDKIEFRVIQKSRIDQLEDQKLTRDEKLAIQGGQLSDICTGFICVVDTCILNFDCIDICDPVCIPNCPTLCLTDGWDICVDNGLPCSTYSPCMAH